MLRMTTKQDEQPFGEKAELTEHLAELRTRLIRSVIYVAFGAVAGWILYDHLFVWLCEPLKPFIAQHRDGLIQTEILGGFMLKLQMSMLFGLILTMPAVTFEVWAFVAPGLTRPERRAVIIVAPVSVLLFAVGVSVAYLILPTGIGWLLAQNPPGVRVMPQVQQAVLFILKMQLAFGLVFQLPVVLMFLAKIGLVDSRLLWSYWRHAVVIIAIVSAVVTPSTDAFSMAMMCGPMVILYFLSITLVRFVERRSR